jgi:hypothetical protein
MNWKNKYKEANLAYFELLFSYLPARTDETKANLRKTGLSAEI